MSSFTIRNVPEAVHRALRLRAAQRGRSMEAEIRDILEQAAKPAGRVKLGSLLARIGREARLTSAQVNQLQRLRDTAPAQPLDFS